MTQDVSPVVDMLERILGGGEVSFEEVQRLRWQAEGELNLFVERIYRELQMFASDADIRGKDLEWDKSWRKGIRKLYDELRKRANIN